MRLYAGPKKPDQKPAQLNKKDRLILCRQSKNGDFSLLHIPKNNSKSKKKERKKAMGLASYFIIASSYGLCTTLYKIQ